jgi:hypothetical protein
MGLARRHGDYQQVVTPGNKQERRIQNAEYQQPDATEFQNEREHYGCQAHGGSAPIVNGAQISNWMGTSALSGARQSTVKSFTES